MAAVIGSLLVTVAVIVIGQLPTSSRGLGAGIDPAAVLIPLLGLAAALTAGLLLAVSLRARFGRVVGDHYGAGIEVAFLASLATQAVAWGMVR